MAGRVCHHMPALAAADPGGAELLSALGRHVYIRNLQVEVDLLRGRRIRPPRREMVRGRLEAEPPAVRRADDRPVLAGA
jgi:hypothetical protein